MPATTGLSPARTGRWKYMDMSLVTLVTLVSHRRTTWTCHAAWYYEYFVVEVVVSSLSSCRHRVVGIESTVSSRRYRVVGIIVVVETRDRLIHPPCRYCRHILHRLVIFFSRRCRRRAFRTLASSTHHARPIYVYWRNGRFETLIVIVGDRTAGLFDTTPGREMEYTYFVIYPAPLGLYSVMHYVITHSVCQPT